ncbi:MAG TPA: hypothetical protein VF019_09185 [Nitrospira sp.]
MRPILVSIVLVGGLVWCGSPTFAREASDTAPRPHQLLLTTVEKVGSGLVWFKPIAGLEYRTVSLHKAERMGLNEPKVGDEVYLVIDESNELIDLHRKGQQPAGHRLIAGKLTYADPFWEFIEITDADGKQTFAMDEGTGSKLSMRKKGELVRVELNEDNEVVDIFPTR